jgi:hypothetical protein
MVVTKTTGSELVDWIYWHLLQYLSLIYPLRKSLGHGKSTQPSLVVFWQRIYKSHYNYNTHKVFSSQANFVALLCTPSILILYFHTLFLLTHSELPASELDSLISTLHGLHGKHRLSTIHRGVYRSVAWKQTSYNSTVGFCGNLFSDPLPSNGHGADHTENTYCNAFSIVACAYFGRCL